MIRPTTIRPAITDDSTLKPLFFSVMVHIALVVALFIWQKNHVVPAGVETLIISSDDLAQIEGQIRENAKLAKQGDNGQHNRTTQSNKSQSASAKAYHEALARKEAAFQAQMEKFAAEQDALIESELAATKRALKAEHDKEQAALAEARESFANHDQTVKENQKALDEARSARDNAIAAAEEAERKSGGTNGSLSDGQPTQITSGTGAPQTRGTTGGSGGASKNDVVSALIAIIRPRWHVPANAKGERLKASIRVDASGNVLSVNVSGGTEALRASLESAIHNSSPLSPLANTDYRSISINFVAE